MYTMQEAFEKMCRHIFEQGERSVATMAGQPVCLYRGPRGLKCVVGALIPDEDYRPEFDGSDIDGSDSDGYSACSLVSDFDPPSLRGLDIDFLMQMQSTHDTDTYWVSSDVMRRRLVKNGSAWNLDVGFLDSLAFKDR